MRWIISGQLFKLLFVVVWKRVFSIFTITVCTPWGVQYEGVNREKENKHRNCCAQNSKVWICARDAAAEWNIHLESSFTMHNAVLHVFIPRLRSTEEWIFCCFNMKTLHVTHAIILYVAFLAEPGPKITKYITLIPWRNCERKYN